MAQTDLLDRSLRVLQNVWQDSPTFNTRSRHRDETLDVLNDMHASFTRQSARSSNLFRKETPSSRFDTDLSLTLTSKEFKIMRSKNRVPTATPIQKSPQDRLYFDFMEAWQRTCIADNAEGLPQDPFETIAEFVMCCGDVLHVARSLDPPESFSGIIEQKKLGEIESERSTWKLIHTLYKDRLSHADQDNDLEDVDMDLVEKFSEQDIINQFYKSNHTVREWQLVVDWLESNASEVLTSGIVERYTDKGVAWENTLHEVQSSSVPYRSTREIVTELDPDAPRRQKKHLHDMDQEDEDRLENEVVKEIRCGRLDEAQSVCNHAGQPWRGAVIDGWRPYHDPNYHSQSAYAFITAMPPQPTLGNHFRDVWKLCAWRACDDPPGSGGLSTRARAALAANCGHLAAMLAVSTTWEDCLWSYLRVQIDVRVERELRVSSSRSYSCDMPPAYWATEISSCDMIFSELSASKSDLIRKEAASPEHLVHKYLILDQIPQLMQEISQWIRGADMSVGGGESSAKPVSGHFLRFLTHLVLFLRHIGRLAACDAIADAVIEAFVKFLIETRESPLIAWYVAYLPKDDQVYYYASYLEDITDMEERSEALIAAERAGLNIALITKTVVENIRQQQSLDADLAAGSVATDADTAISADDQMKISSLDWLLFHTHQRADMLVQANALIAHFLANGNAHAARAAFNKIPENTLGLIQPKTSESNDDPFINIALGQVPKQIALATREYLCYKTYLDADESFSDWFQYFHNGKPVEPVLPTQYTFMEKVAYQHKHNQYKIEYERWKSTMDNQTSQTSKLLSNVLTFPLGWLLDDAGADTDYDVDVNEHEDRTIQLNGLRATLLPRCAFLLHTVLHSTGDYTGCIAIADLIASPQHHLFKIFSKQKLKDLLIKIGESSLELMNEGKDPWGCPL